MLTEGAAGLEPPGRIAVFTLFELRRHIAHSPFVVVTPNATIGYFYGFAFHFIPLAAQVLIIVIAIFVNIVLTLAWFP